MAICFRSKQALRRAMRQGSFADFHRLAGSLVFASSSLMILTKIWLSLSFHMDNGFKT